MNTSSPQPSKDDLDLAASIFLEIRMFLFPTVSYVPGSSGERFLAEQLAKIRLAGFEDGYKTRILEEDYGCTPSEE